VRWIRQQRWRAALHFLAEQGPGLGGGCDIASKFAAPLGRWPPLARLGGLLPIAA